MTNTGGFVLFELTRYVDLAALGATLWMALYLFARGSSNAVTLRAVIVLMLLSVFFLGAHSALFDAFPGMAPIRAAVVLLALGAWYSLTYRLASPVTRVRLKWLRVAVFAVYGAMALLAAGGSSTFGVGQDEGIFIARLQPGPAFFVYPGALMFTSAAILYNLLAGDRIGFSPQGRFFLVASVIIAASAAYGSLALVSAIPLPRLLLDALIFAGVFLLGVSVARHQTLLERRTTLQDFPVSGAAMLAITAFYLMLAFGLGLPESAAGAVVALVVLTHSVYDVVHEALAQLRLRREARVRKRLRELEDDVRGDDVLQARLRRGLGLLCQTLRSMGGFIALRPAHEGPFTVMAHKHSLAVGTHLDASMVSCDDLTQVRRAELPDIDWLAPAFEGDEQIAVIGIRKPAARVEYAAADLDLLAEVADHVGTIVALSSRREIRPPHAPPDASAAKTGVFSLPLASEEMLSAAVSRLDPELIKNIEECLRHLPDFVALGESRLAAWMEVGGATPVERGKTLNGLLKNAIEVQRPAAAEPPGTLPREWYGYHILHEAYVGDVPNRVIMNRLYISEGTFNRIRRTAVRGLARTLIETSSPMLAAGAA